MQNVSRQLETSPETSSSQTNRTLDQTQAWHLLRKRVMCNRTGHTVTREQEETHLNRTCKSVQYTNKTLTLL